MEGKKTIIMEGKKNTPPIPRKSEHDANRNAKQPNHTVHADTTAREKPRRTHSSR